MAPLLLLIAVGLLSVIPCAWAQTPGFFNIDCGSTAPRVDPVTGISWVPDGNYILTGLNFPNVPGAQAFYQNFSDYTTLRYFPNPRAKNCYALPATPNGTYLLRASFYYGAYDNLTAAPSFQLAIDETVVSNISFTGKNVALNPEFTLQTQSETIFLCLVRDKSQSVPFVSSISLRPFGPVQDVYRNMADHLGRGGFYQTLARFNLGGVDIVRFPADSFDRNWIPQGQSSAYVQSGAPIQPLATNQPISDAYFTGLQRPPQEVMQTALTTLGNLTITVGSIASDPNFLAYLIFYFAEIDPTANATSRNFSIQVPTFSENPENPFKSTSGSYATGWWDYGDWSFTSVDSAIVMYPGQGSKMGPLLNAMEFFQVIPSTAAATIGRDAVAVNEMKAWLNLTDWYGDPCLPVAHEWLTCNSVSLTISPQILAVNLSSYSLTTSIPPSIVDLHGVTSMSLDNNILTGTIPDLSTLILLETLHLQNNNLSGPIPPWLAFLPQLKELFLQNNNFSGSIPPGLLNRNTLNFKYDGNRYLIGPNASSANMSSGSPKSSNLGIIVGASIGGIVALAFIIALITVCLWRRCGTNPNGQTNLRNRKPQNVTSEENEREGTIQNQGAKAYSLAEVVGATDNFKHEIGKGGFGPVFYGKLPDGNEVAVKVSDKKSNQGASEFFNEVDLLSRVHHRNVVSLVGYCQEDGNQMLIYEYMNKGSLRDHLYGIGGSKAIGESLDWRTRLNIALDASQGLDYLHTGCNPSIIHRDVKSSNILLSNKKVAKVADFGLSKLGPDEGATHVATNIKGTTGYLDPEYIHTQFLTTKSDVFSFGVVLLELISGRIPLDMTLPNHGDWNICDWVRSNLQGGNIDNILDPIVRASNPNLNGVWKVAEIAMQCVEPKSRYRPSMDDVTQELRAAINMEGNVHSTDTSKSHLEYNTFTNMSDDAYKSDVKRGGVSMSSFDASYLAPR